MFYTGNIYIDLGIPLVEITVGALTFLIINRLTKNNLKLSAFISKVFSIENFGIWINIVFLPATALLFADHFYFNEKYIKIIGIEIPVLIMAGLVAIFAGAMFVSENINEKFKKSKY